MKHPPPNGDRGTYERYEHDRTNYSPSGDRQSYQRYFKAHDSANLSTQADRQIR